MPIKGFYERLTADSGGDAVMNIEDNGLVAMVHVSPVGSVDAGSTGAVQQSFVTAGTAVTRTLVAAEAVNAAADLWAEADGYFPTAKNRTLKIVIASAAEADAFDVFVDMISDD